MANDLALKAFAFIAFVAFLGGTTYGAYQVIQPEPLTPRGLGVDVVEPTLSVQPGAAVSFGALVQNRGVVAEDVRLSIEADGLTSDPVTLSLNESARAARFVTVHVPEGTAVGALEARLVAETVNEPVKRASRTVTLNVLATGDGITEGEGAELLFTGRLPDGRVALTNMPGVDDAPFPRHASYEFSPGNATVYTGSGSTVLTGLREGLLGMQAGETRTLHLTAEEAFGPARVEQTEPRVATLPRENEFSVSPQPYGLEDFAQVLAENDQGTPDEYEVGDHFRVTQGGNSFRYVVTEKTDENVMVRLEPEVGDRFTDPQMAFWPEATEVTFVNETVVKLYTTPTTDVGEPFTFREEWPDASVVTSMNETHILVEHTPEVGTEYDRQSMFGGAQRVRVDAVEEDVIRVSYASPNPLAGRDVVFDVHVLEVLPPRNTE